MFNNNFTTESVFILELLGRKMQDLCIFILISQFEDIVLELIPLTMHEEVPLEI